MESMLQQMIQRRSSSGDLCTPTDSDLIEDHLLARLPGRRVQYVVFPSISSACQHSPYLRKVDFSNPLQINNIDNQAHGLERTALLAMDVDRMLNFVEIASSALTNLKSRVNTALEMSSVRKVLNRGLRKLPNEVLFIILDLAIRKPSDILRFMHINRRFRHQLTSIHSGRIWADKIAHLVYDMYESHFEMSPELLQCFLEHSSLVPLKLVLMATDGCFAPILELLVDAAERWSHICLDGGQKEEGDLEDEDYAADQEALEVFRTLDIFQLYLPALEEIMFKEIYFLPDLNAYQKCQWLYPRLKILSFEWCPFLPSSIWGIEDLQELELRFRFRPAQVCVKTTDFLGLDPFPLSLSKSLQQERFQNLAKLVIAFFFSQSVKDRHSASLDLPVTTLPNVTSFELILMQSDLHSVEIVTSLIRALNFPSLTNVILRVTHSAKMNTWHPNKGVRHWDAHHIWKKVRYQLSTEEIWSLIPSQDRVENLTLDVCQNHTAKGAWEFSINNILTGMGRLIHLSLSSHGPFSYHSCLPALPRLKHLEFRECPNLKSSTALAWIEPLFSCETFRYRGTASFMKCFHGEEGDKSCGKEVIKQFFADKGVMLQITP